MATLTASLATSGGVVRAVHAGLNCINGSYNSGATAVSASGSALVLLCKLPTGAVIVDAVVRHSTGATARGLNVGIRDGQTTSMSVGAIFSAGAQATLNRMTVPGYTLSATDAETFKYLVASGTSGTVTTSLIVNFSIFYQMP